MGLFDFLKGADPERQARQQAGALRRAQITASLDTDAVPPFVAARLQGARSGALPWMATLTPAELMIVRSHGLRPIASVSATCWMHYGRSWTMGHQQGWETALRRLREEAVAAGANAVLDVKMRTIPLAVPQSMDFTLVGTAVRLEGMPASREPIVATVPALEFVRLIEADVVPTGIAVGAHYDWLASWKGDVRQTWMGNIESRQLGDFWEQVKRRAHAELRQHAKPQGNGVLAHVNFSQMFEVERDNQPPQYLGRHIVVATVLDTGKNLPLPHAVGMALDMRGGGRALQGASSHHQSYASNEREGPL